MGNRNPQFQTKQFQPHAGLERRVRRGRLKRALKQGSTRKALEDAVAQADERGFVRGGMTRCGLIGLGRGCVKTLFSTKTCATHVPGIKGAWLIMNAKDKMIECSKDVECVYPAHPTFKEAVEQYLGLDPVNQPPHYKVAGIELIDVLEAFKLDQHGHLMIAVQYIMRAYRKGKPLEDLKKAQWYLNRHIANMEKSA